MPAEEVYRKFRESGFTYDGIVVVDNEPLQLWKHKSNGKVARISQPNVPGVGKDQYYSGRPMTKFITTASTINDDDDLPLGFYERAIIGPILAEAGVR